MQIDVQLSKLTTILKLPDLTEQLSTNLGFFSPLMDQNIFVKTTHCLFLYIYYLLCARRTDVTSQKTMFSWTSSSAMNE